MRGKTLKRNENRLKKKKRVRKKISGTEGRPRLVVFRSLKNIYVQLVDDTHHKTITGTSSLSKALTDTIQGKTKKEAATEVGKRIAEKAKEKNITTVVFDRNGYLYHGRVKALAEGARKGGLTF